MLIAVRRRQILLKLRPKSFYKKKKKTCGELKSVSSNSTLAVHSGFDLHRFLQVFGKKGQDLNLGPADQKLVVLTITLWLVDDI